MSGVEVEVRQGDCPCPGHPHDVEKVTLMPELPLANSIFAFKTLANTEAKPHAKMAALIASYIPGTIEEWTFTDEAGAMVPITQENAERLIPWDRGGYAVTERANSLYTDRVLGPFLPPRTTAESPSLLPTRKSSQDGAEVSSISPLPVPGSEPPTPSRRSSRTNSEAGKQFADPAP